MDRSTQTSLEQKDIARHFHAYTNMALHQEKGPFIIERGDGVFVYDNHGKRYIEAMSGLWSVAVGFNEQRLADVAAAQMRKLPFYHTFTHKSHGPVIELADKLVSMAPVPMSKAFFTNSGSEANETAIKLIWYYNNAIGRPKKKKLISRHKAYHGVTVAASSLTGLPMNHLGFDLPIAGVLHTACPHHYRFAQPGETEEEFSSRLAKELEDLILAEGPDTVAAFFGEPVMGAGGVLVPPRTYWQKIQEVCRRYDVLVVADEVICGFGRTGNMFGAQTYGIEPDMMVLSKQLSSSYLPISALLINDKLFQAISARTGTAGGFGHGLTAGGHPVAAAVALENIKIIEERNLVANAARMGERLRAGLARFADHPLVGEVRGVGLIAAVEMVADKKTKATFDPVGQVAAYLNERAVEHGMILRSIGDAIGFCPPLIVKEDEIDMILERFGRALDETHAWNASR